MYAGKSSELIRDIRMLSLDFPLCEILVVNHSLDDRYTSDNLVTTHDNDTEECIKTHSLALLFDNQKFKKASHVFIDEGQFFDKDDILNFTKDCIYTYSKKLTIAGLISGINMNDIGGVGRLVKYADNISVISGDCFYCNRGSYCVMLKDGVNKLSEEDDLLQKDKLNCYNFISVCRKCWHEHAV